MIVYTENLEGTKAWIQVVMLAEDTSEVTYKYESNGYTKPIKKTDFNIITLLSDTGETIRSILHRARFEG